MPVHTTEYMHGGGARAMAPPPIGNSDPPGAATAEPPAGPAGYWASPSDVNARRPSKPTEGSKGSWGSPVLGLNKTKSAHEMVLGDRFSHFVFFLLSQSAYAVGLNNFMIIMDALMNRCLQKLYKCLVYCTRSNF